MLILAGDGDFDFDIVGESFYQDALEAIVGGRSDESAEHECRAVLVPEADNPYDKNAVWVLVDGHKVGHLSRDDAKVYRRFLARHAQSGAGIYCDAMIVGGWVRRGETASFGVKLDLIKPFEFDEIAIRTTEKIYQAPESSQTYWHGPESGQSRFGVWFIGLALLALIIGLIAIT